MEILVPIWILCAILGGMVGSRNRAGGLGFMIGLLFGPLGVIAAFSLDKREKCPCCGGRLNGLPLICPHCNSSLEHKSSEQGQIANNDLEIGCSVCKCTLTLPASSIGDSIICPNCQSRAIVRLFSTSDSVSQQVKKIQQATNDRLRPCPDCDCEISKRAKHCPQCGCPIQ